MKAAVLYKKRDLRIKEISLPVLKKGHALLKVLAVGVCGSDVHYFTRGRIGDQVITRPHILGHEVSAEVVKVPRNRRGIRPGMRVAVEPGISCGTCEHCRKGRPNICTKVRFLGTPPVSGANREYLSYPVDCLFPLPKSMSPEEGALLEPLTIGWHSVELSKLQKGEDIAILGFGPIGICTLKAALLRKPRRIFITELIPERLRYAGKTFRNITVINAGRGDPVKTIQRMTKGRGVDVVYECAGKQETIRQSVEAAAVGGRVVWIGIPSGDFISIDPHIARRKELVILFDRRARHAYPKCIKAVTQGKIVLKDMVTHVFKLKDIARAFSLVEHYKNGVIKAVIH